MAVFFVKPQKHCTLYKGGKQTKLKAVKTYQITIFAVPYLTAALYPL